jgi:hypothetical protein
MIIKRKLLQHTLYEIKSIEGFTPSSKPYTVWVYVAPKALQEKVNLYLTPWLPTGSRNKDYNKQSGVARRAI